MVQRLDERFTGALDDAKQQSQKIGDYLRGEPGDGGPTERHWMIPSSLRYANPRGFEPTDIGSIGDGFDRQDLNIEYGTQLNKAGSSSDEGMMGNIVVTGIQLNYMAMLERSFRERHKTDVRLQMHVAGRRIAHGSQDGVHTGSVQPYLQAYIDNTNLNPA